MNKMHTNLDKGNGSCLKKEKACECAGQKKKRKCLYIYSKRERQTEYLAIDVIISNKMECSFYFRGNILLNDIYRYLYNKYNVNLVISTNMIPHCFFYINMVPHC